MMIAGDGFFVTRSGSATSLTRAGAFEFDANGRLTSPDGGIVQGWMARPTAVLPTGGALTDISLPRDLVAPGVATSSATLTGNLPKETPPQAEPSCRTRKSSPRMAASRNLTMTFTRTAHRVDVAARRWTTVPT